MTPVCTLILCGFLTAGRFDGAPPTVECDTDCWCEEWQAPSPSTLQGWATRYGSESVMAATLAYNGLTLPTGYAGAIATKSPSDLGRTYYLVGVGNVLVGDVAAFNDFAPVGQSVRGDARLSRVYVDGKPWVADLPNDLYYAVGGDGGPVAITLVGSSPQPVARNAPCPDVTQASTLIRPAPDSLPVEVPYRQPPAPQLICPTWSCDRDAVMIQGVNWVNHWGDDIWTPTDRTVYSPTAGRVVYVGEWNGLGGEVVLDLGGGWWMRVGHLQVINRVALPVGEYIPEGTFLGWVGQSGHTLDGHHAHIELFWGDRPHDILQVIADQPAVRDWQGYWQ